MMENVWNSKRATSDFVEVEILEFLFLSHSLPFFSSLQRPFQNAIK